MLKRMPLLELDSALEKENSVRKKAEDWSLGDLVYKYRLLSLHIFHSGSHWRSV